MKRPYIICHMVTSADGKVTGDFLRSPHCERATEVYYELHRRYREQGASGFICGRVTMEESFTGGWYPDLSAYAPAKRENGPYQAYWAEQSLDFYAVAFDPKGRLGWRSVCIRDDDPGYDRSHIVEVLTEQADARYLTYLRELGISYIVAGKEEIDVRSALRMLDEHRQSERWLLEGGSILNGHFLRADCVDELSLVQAPVTADADSKPLFMNGAICGFSPMHTEQQGDVLVMHYKNTI